MRKLLDSMFYKERHVFLVGFYNLLHHEHDDSICKRHQAIIQSDALFALDFQDDMFNHQKDKEVWHGLLKQRDEKYNIFYSKLFDAFEPFTVYLDCPIWFWNFFNFLKHG